LWQTWAELIFYLRSGCDKPRYQILAPANLDAGGDLVALEKYSQHVVAIRAVGGHSYLRVDPAEMGRVKVTHETCPQLFHVTYRNNIPSLNKTGLRPGGLNPYGRNEMISAVNRNSRAGTLPPTAPTSTICIKRSSRERPKGNIKPHVQP